jgi:hypothetical protein
VAAAATPIVTMRSSTPAVAPIDRAQAALPLPLRRVPLPALLAWTGLAAIAAVVSLAITVRSAGAVEALEQDEDGSPAAAAGGSTAPATKGDGPIWARPTPPRAPRAPEADLETARRAGADALTSLAQRFPADPAVLKALFLAQAADKKSYLVALRTARRLTDVAKDAGNDPAVSGALVAIANGPSDTAAVALDLMASEMGRRGTELLFEVASGSVLTSKTKAAAMLKDPDVRRNASPAVLIANDLLEARPCARKELLARAGADGDARSLPFLKPLLTQCGGAGGGGGIGRFFGRVAPAAAAECYRCFTPADREAIQSTIAAIEARSPAPAPTAAPTATPGK